MPTKLRKVIEREVVSVREGRALGRPDDILIDPEAHRVALVVVNSGAVPDTALVDHPGAVKSFEADRLAIDSLDALTIAGRDEAALARFSRVSTSLGKVANVVIDERGNVVQYRIRKGLLGYLGPTTKIEPSALGTAGGEVAVVDDLPGTPPTA